MQEAGRIELNGTVTGSLPRNRFRVALANGKQVSAGVAGKVRMDLIRILPGTQVSVEFSPYDLSKGRIVGIQQ